MGTTYGLIFPVTIANGALYEPSLEDSITSSIRTILAWEPNSRYFNTPFGAGLYKFLSEPNDSHSESAIEILVTRAISDFEKRITIKSVNIQREGSAFSIAIYVTVNETQKDLTINING